VRLLAKACGRPLDTPPSVRISGLYHSLLSTQPPLCHAPAPAAALGVVQLAHFGPCMPDPDVW
jgi:hypothetical protein